MNIIYLHLVRLCLTYISNVSHLVDFVLILSIFENQVEERDRILIEVYY